MSKFEPRGKKIGEDSGNGKLLHDIETISKALYLDRNPSKSSYTAPSNRSKSAGKTHLLESKSKTKYVKEDPSQKEKKSFWNWKSLKAISHIRHKRFNCCFSLQVHTIEELPSNFTDVSLCVHWKRRDEGMVTRPAKVFQGIAEFEESLTHTCSVYGSRNGPHHSAKYEAKHFLLYASVFGAPDLDLGKHRVDLTRLLPLTLEELEEEKSTGSWTTSFKLSGKGKGATMHVSFGYSVIWENPTAHTHGRNVPEVMNLKQSTEKSVTKFGQSDDRGSTKHVLPGNFTRRSRASSRSVEDIRVLHEVLPTAKSELSSSLSMLYQKFDENKLDTLDYRPEPDVSAENLEPLKPDTNSSLASGEQSVEKESEDNEFSVIEHGIEFPSKEQMKSDDGTIKFSDDSAVEKVDFVETESGVGVTFDDDNNIYPQDAEDINCRGALVVSDCYTKEEDTYTKESLMKDLESALNSITNLEMAGSDSPEEQEDYMEIKSDYDTIRKTQSHNLDDATEGPLSLDDATEKSLSLDDATDSVASEFLNMLGIEHSPFGPSSDSEPESPRERLLRQFEKDALSGGFPLFDFDICEGDQAGFDYNAATASEWGNLSEDIGFPSMAEAGEDVRHEEIQASKRKTRATMLEDLETESLMREWGLNENTFQYSPPSCSGGFGSPIDLPLEDSLQLPPLGEALGPFLQTKNGGFVRSMNPALFKNAKTSGSLIMQVSSPVVVPAEMGSGIMEILQGLASVGIEKLSMQANKLMPLEDITGKTMQQIAWEAEAVPGLEAPESQYMFQHESEVGQDPSGVQKRVKGKSYGPSFSNSDSSPVGNETGSEYVSLEDLAPLAMDKIEALSMEGLRIQSGMSEEVAPSNISAQSIGDISALEGKGINISGSLGLEGTAGLQLLDIKDNADDVDGLMGLSLTLDEWMRLDSGDFDDDEDQISERTSKILAAHHANSLGTIRGGSKGEKRRGKNSSKKGGLLGNNFTVALMVQLRDPLRNYEPVGTPMLSLIQVERVFIPPKPKIYSTVSELRSSNEGDGETESVVKKEVKEETKEESLEEQGIPQFKITEVHVAGLKIDTGKKKLWGTKTQQQSGSRWLVANGMGKGNKHPFMKSKGVGAKSNAPVTTKVQPGDTLWSISSRVHGTGTKWKDLAALNPHIRNPNIILPNETIRLC